MSSLGALLDGKYDKTYIIAEIGGNFNTYDEAVALIDAAKNCGVNAVKIQTYKADTITTKNAVFDMENIKSSQYEYFKQFELSGNIQEQVFKYANDIDLDCFSTPSYFDDVDMLKTLGVKAFKIGADDANNLPFVKYIAQQNLPVFLSTGMCDFKEVKKAVNTIKKEDNNRIVLFHTVSCYPTYPENVNLNVIKTFIKEFPDLIIGFSDHTLTTLACIAAVAMGAKVIEKHFTLDKEAEGPDHRLSATPGEMKYIVESIREVEIMKGSFIKKPVGEELQNRSLNRKYIVAKRNIQQEELLSKDNLIIKRSTMGIEPKYYDKLIGKKVIRQFKKDENIIWEDVQ